MQNFSICLNALLREFLEGISCDLTMLKKDAALNGVASFLSRENHSQAFRARRGDGWITGWRITPKQTWAVLH